MDKKNHKAGKTKGVRETSITSFSLPWKLSQIMWNVTLQGTMQVLVSLLGEKRLFLSVLLNRSSN
jgi:hypothetical protein